VFKLAKELVHRHNNSTAIPEHDDTKEKWLIEPDSIPNRKHPQVSNGGATMGYSYMDELDNELHHPPAAATVEARVRPGRGLAANSH
jgi:hypothetical protein